MDELLGKFLEDQKTKIAEEKACLEQDPPYMEMRVRENILRNVCNQTADSICDFAYVWFQLHVVPTFFP
uniref:Uncharacterized protein n=1 Tax=Sinocyclocheilus rhinocerous TaxID=307959 RepID=A0A673LXT4_9TELE